MSFDDHGIVVLPLGGGQDDGPAIRAALATGKVTYLTPGDYLLRGRAIWPSRSLLVGTPRTTLYYDTTDFGAMGAPIYAHWSATWPPIVATTVAEPGVVGSRRLRVVDPTLLTVGTRFALEVQIGGTYQWDHIMQYRVLAAAPDGWLTLDGALDYAYATTTRLVLPPTPADYVEGIRIHGNGMRMLPAIAGDATYRAIWLSLAWECDIRDLEIDASGCSFVGANYDEGGVRSAFRRVRVTGDGTRPMHGIYLESQRGTVAEDCRVTNLTTDPTDHGITLVSCWQSRVERSTVEGPGIYFGRQGTAFDAGCSQTTISGAVVIGSPDAAIKIHKPGADNAVRDCVVCDPSTTTYAIILDEQTRLRIDGCLVRGGTYGLQIAASPAAIVSASVFEGQTVRSVAVVTGSVAHVERCWVRPGANVNWTQAIYCDGAGSIVLTRDCIIESLAGTNRARSYYANTGGFIGVRGGRFVNGAGAQLQCFLQTSAAVRSDGLYLNSGGTDALPVWGSP